MRARRFIFPTFGAAALLLTIASLAWACNGVVSRPYAEANPNQAPVGSQVAVRGVQWATSTSVQIRWNSETGVVLGSAQPGPDGSFSRGVTIPSDVTAGSYAIVAVQGSVQDTIPFEVITTGVTGSTTMGAGSGAIGQPSSTPSAAPGAPRLPSSDRSPRSGVVPSAGGDPAGAGIVPGAAPSTQAGQPAGAVSAQADALASTRRSAAAELWSGFAPGSKLGRAAPSLTALPKPAGAMSEGQTAGLALLAVALVALFGGYGVAELSRRRAFARKVS